MSKEILATRSQFLKGGAVAGAAIAAATAATAWAEEAAGADMQTEILVLGGGIGGTFAAYEASQAGAQVILVEAAQELGGTALISSGGVHSSSMWGPEDVSKGVPTGDPVLATAYMTMFKDIYDNWIEATGVEAPKNDDRMRFSLGGTDADARKAFFTYFYDRLVEKGVQVIFKQRAFELLNDADGKVCGAKIADRQGNVTSIAAKKVILATGSWAADKEKAARYWGPWADKVIPRCVPFNTGDGLEMALSQGAKLTQSFGWFYGQVAPYPSIIPTDPDGYDAYSKYDAWLFLSTLQHFSAQGLFVNFYGKRFLNENGAPQLAGRFAEEILRQPKGRVFLVLDSTTTVVDFIPTLEELQGLGMEMDVVDTFEDLVAALEARGVHGPGFRSMAAEYQAAEDKSQLDIPKTAVGENPIMNLDNPPFYVIPMTSAASAAFGGVAIDTQAHVLNRANMPIENLFATACVAGGIFYNEYGGSLGASSSFGIIAARTALAELGY